MSAATERERRATAGRRMSHLVGKAAEEDETFWSHDVWAENDSGNDSFHESDEDPEQRVDRFDSDFDDSETDNEAEELAAGEAEEAELQREERSSRKRKYVDIAKAGRDLLQKKKGSSRKRKKDLMGDGINAGLVLNLPPPTGAAPPSLTQSATSATVPQLVRSKNKAKPGSPAKPAATLASTRSLRSTHGKRQLRAATRNKSMQRQSAADTRGRQTASHGSHQMKKQQKKFTQEELLLEAATVTEPENERWLLGRKRIMDLENLVSNKDASAQREVRGKVLFKFHSRRGCFNTLTFPEMDSVPAILARRQVKPKRPRKQVCVITGKRARYRDPKTNLGYHDLAAFKELRRRRDAGEPLDQRKAKVTGVEKDGAPSSNAAKNDEKTAIGKVPSINGKEQAKILQGTDSQTEPKEPPSKSMRPTATEETSLIDNATSKVSASVPNNDAGCSPKKTSAPKVPELAMRSRKKTVAVDAAANTSNVSTARNTKVPSASIHDNGQAPTNRKETKTSKNAKPGTKDAKAEPTNVSVMQKTRQTTQLEKPRKTASPATTSMIHHALAAYAKLQKHEKDK